MILIDTSALIDSLTGPRRSAVVLRQFVERGERLGISTIVLYEWLRGPRQPEELDLQRRLLPNDEAIPFGPLEAAVASDLYRMVKRPRGRELDLAIAAIAVLHDASLWTLNPRDFADIPRLTLAQ